MIYVRAFLDEEICECIPDLHIMNTLLALILSSFAAGQLFPNEFNFNPQLSLNELRDVTGVGSRSVDTTKEAFLDALVANLTVPELGTLRSTS